MTRFNPKSPMYRVAMRFVPPVEIEVGYVAAVTYLPTNGKRSKSRRGVVSDTDYDPDAGTLSYEFYDEDYDRDIRVYVGSRLGESRVDSRKNEWQKLGYPIYGETHAVDPEDYMVESTSRAVLDGPSAGIQFITDVAVTKHVEKIHENLELKERQS